MSLSLQKGIDPNTGQTVWVMLDDDYQVVEPVQRYLTYLTSSKSPNTVETYGYGLKAWWEFLSYKNLDWVNVELSSLEDFAYFLHVGEPSKVVSMQAIQAKRTQKSINIAITAVTNFYEYHLANKTIDEKHFDKWIITRGTTRQGLLQGIAKSKPVRQKLVKLKEPRIFPGCLTGEQIEILVNNCHRLRDKLIILMLNSTGMRKGEMLGLCHEDIGDFDDHTIRVVQRQNHSNGARAKGLERVIPVPKELITLYNNYLIHEYPDKNSDYVFVNIWSGNIGTAMNLRVLNTMFSRLSKKTGIKVYPHLMRHSYATRLLKAGMSADRVKYLLGHTSIQTTLDIYSHIIDGSDLLKVIEIEE